MRIKRNPSDKIQVKMHSGMRGEIVVLFLIWLVILVLSAATGEKMAGITSGIFPLTIAWFQFIFRAQQEILQKSIKNHLKRS
ncbi:hypothetical protein [Flavobacterium sp.]|uniref:hypothetical protein n=1 Tax=Flavobacterium sp. TaxID=239 RepID=UPI001214A5FE|nr:hypothetical protein [Flavobacterium sp.]RZJ72003.1 MAG: hypothetical protein EOO49_08210 [Flavobacterium sp.]